MYLLSSPTYRNLTDLTNKPDVRPSWGLTKLFHAMQSTCCLKQLQRVHGFFNIMNSNDMSTSGGHGTRF